MGRVDAYREPEVQDLAAAWREAGVADPAATPRIGLLRALLDRDDQRALGALRARNRVLVYGFAAGLEPLAALDFERPEPAADRTPAAGGTPGAEPGPQRLDLGAVRAEGTYTNLGGAVRTALARSSAANIAGVLILSDGRRNLGPQGPEVARLLRNRGVPQVVVVPVGDPSPTRTLRLLRLDAPEKVFQEDPFTVRAVVEGRGYEDLAFAVRLLRQPVDGGEPSTIGEQTVRVAAAAPEVEVAFEDLKIGEAGAFTFTVEIDPPELEPRVDERHVRRARIEALAERTRVLLVAGGPSHEYRILRNLLIRDDTIEVACWLSSADRGFPQDGDVSLEALPSTPDEFASWDVFLFLDPDPERLERPFCEQVARQVAENGAGLWWACGEKFTLDALRAGANTESLVEILPVVPDLDDAESIALARGMRLAWAYELTAEGRVHPAARILEDRAASEALWGRLPGFHFAFPVERPKPAAQVLVAHRKPIGGSDPADPTPLLVTQFFGAGRVLFTATDDLYRWRSVSEVAYDRLWVRGIRFLFEGRLNAGNSRLRIGIDEERIELGQAVKVVAEARTETFEPLVAAGFELALREGDGVAERFVLKPVEGAAGRFEAWVRPTATGWFRVEPLEAAEGRSVGASFEVVPAALEKEGPADLAELTAIAAAPGGVLVATPAEFDAALDRIASQTRIETFTSAQTLWDSWATVALLTVVLALEWWLRKRANLL
jgi:hypothetical protein